MPRVHYYCNCGGWAEYLCDQCGGFACHSCALQGCDCRLIRAHAARTSGSLVFAARQRQQRDLLSTSDLPADWATTINSLLSDLELELEPKTRFNIPITSEVLQCLQPGTWLGDEVMNFVLELLRLEHPNIQFFNTHFYNKMFWGGSGSVYKYSNVRQWAIKAYIPDRDALVIPINVGQIHWTVAVVDFRGRWIEYYNSTDHIAPRRREYYSLADYLQNESEGAERLVIATVHKFLEDEASDRGTVHNATEWRVHFTQGIPRQDDGYNCGVFVLAFVNFFTSGMNAAFTSADCDGFRLVLLWRILKALEASELPIKKPIL